MPISKEAKLEIFKGIIAVVVGVAIFIATFYIGKSTGQEGKREGFDQILTQVKLDNTKWEVSYEDAMVLPSPTPTPTPPKNAKQGKNPPPPPTPSPTPPPKLATVEFKQFGSRIVGTGRDLKGREWIIEGAAAERRVCYIYYDSGGQLLSFGTVLLEMDRYAKEMRGQWVGWSPEANELQLRPVTLKRL